MFTKVEIQKAARKTVVDVVSNVKESMDVDFDLYTSVSDIRWQLRDEIESYIHDLVEELETEIVKVAKKLIAKHVTEVNELRRKITKQAYKD
jgi:uncharacterized protein YijF (DUF1287 family)